MPIKIDSIDLGSLAEQRDIQPGDIILEINNEPIGDFIDLQFHGGDEHLLIKLRTPKGEIKKISIMQNWETPLGINPVPHSCTSCINNCIFCFVDQMRPGFRDSLYIKDDDFRLSFVYGNFITLTNLTDFHIRRIIDQRLSPLYVSVHTTNPELHRTILRYTRDFNIMEALTQLKDGDIDLHTQIVVIPGWNDGDELERSLKDLDSLGDNVLSIGIVPVGITRFRKNLTQLPPVDSSKAKEILEIASNYPRTFCSDELYVLADQPIPEEDFYEGYPQLENGIGMMRLFLENWAYEKEDFLEEIGKFNQKILFITAKSATKLINQIADDINSVIPHKARVQTISNDFFGTTVTVTGLLTATDIINQIELAENELAVISAGIFNDDDLTLDGLHIKEFISKIGKPILLVDEEFADWELIEN